MCNDVRYGTTGTCPVGRFTNANSQCELCPAGRYSFGDSTSCSNCPVGKYVSVLGSSICFDCPKHFYSDVQGSSACTECPTYRRTSTEGSTSLQDCTIQQCPVPFFSWSVSSIAYFADTSNRRGPSRFFQARADCQDAFHGGQLISPIDSSSYSFIQSSPTIQGPTWISSFVLGTRVYNSNSSLQVVQTSPFSSVTYTNNLYGSALYLDASKNLQRQLDNVLTNYYCQVNQFYCSLNSSCPSGTFLNVNQPIIQCQDCQSGSYSNVSDSLQCVDCLAGSYSTAGLSSCLLCSPGYFTNSLKSTSCSICPNGRYSFQPGSTGCTVCPTGSFVQSGSTSCVLCPAGKFSSSPTNLCTSCPSGFLSSSNGSTSCDICYFGQFSTVGQSSCSPCSKGRFQDLNGTSECKDCPQNMYSNDTGLSSCYLCPSGSKNIVRGSISIQDCSICTAGFYGRPMSIPCAPCRTAEGVSCPENSTIPFIDPGYFRSSDDVSIALKCQPETACLRTEWDEHTVCGVGYIGDVCGSCDDNFYKFNSQCKSCPGAAAKWTSISIAAVVIAILLFRVSSQSKEIPVDIRIVLQGIQLIALFPTITMKWPPYVLSFLQLLSLAVSDYLLRFSHAYRFAEFQHRAFQSRVCSQNWFLGKVLCQDDSSFDLLHIYVFDVCGERFAGKDISKS
jgi:hypothetical protein